VFAAAGTAVPVLVVLAHGGVAIVVIAAVVGAAAGLATYLASPSSKKDPSCPCEDPGDTLPVHLTDVSLRRFAAARISGLASGLASPSGPLGR